MAAYQLSDHCTPTSLYLIRLSSAFKSCVPTDLAFLSTSLGVFSIISWLFAQVPQIYKNYQLQSASGLSIYFLAEWLLGDLTNLLGALMTGQATWQVVVALYYVTVDVILCCQYVWYTHLNPRGKTQLAVHTSNDNGDDDRSGNNSSRDILIGVSPPEESESGTHEIARDDKHGTKSGNVSAQQQALVSGERFGVSHPREKDTWSSSRTVTRTDESPSFGSSPKALLFISIFCIAVTNASPLSEQAAGSRSSASNSEFVGRILSWTSTLLYLGSRLPQIYKNAVRRSTSGLSPTLFIAAFCGNFFYSTSLLTNPLAWSSYPPYGLHGWVGPEGSDRKTWIELAAPFWLGAAGVLIMDATIGGQFLLYGEGQEKSIVILEDRGGRSRWREVRGWMRGWIPSPGPNNSKADQPDLRPLLEGQRRSSGEYGAA